MATDDERREVARRLRGQAKMLGPNMDAHEFAHYTADVIDVNECMTWHEMTLFLADLIEPSYMKHINLISDDERRRVAERLMASIPGDGVMRRGDKGWSLLYRTIFGHYMGNQSAGRTYSEVAGRLADLIEPPTQCPYYRSDRHYCSIHDVPAMDRDALMALADEMDGLGLSGLSSGWSSGMVNVGSFARRIREACGEEDE